MRIITALSLALLAISPCVAADMERISVSADGKGFVTESGEQFIPWGFNYDHDEQGRLIEDYWDDEWPKIESDFQEMKSLGANVVRIHLQTGKFMTSPDKPNQNSLDQLKRLVTLAEETGLYLDLTGLGCYHKADVPDWYDAMSEQERWTVQAKFWEAVAETCQGSPAVFCYDLMNEPVVPGGKQQDWLGPPLGDKHFVQRIGLDLAGRDRPEVARQWIEMLTKAIRKHDQQTLVTVGLVHWSLDRPGLKSGFVPEKIADSLDFLCVHLYPEKGKVDEAIETLEAFAAAGKPVVIEETFVHKSSVEEFAEFLDRSEGIAVGWMGFYWGKNPEELQPPNTIPEALMLSWLKLFQERNPAEKKSDPKFQNVTCEGSYPHHLQGICTDGRQSLYWSYTDVLVRTGRDGKLLQQVPVANHHGDLCFHNGKLFVAVNLGNFNQPAGQADSWIYIYDAETLKEIARHAVPEVVHGAGGIAYYDGRFLVVGGLPPGTNENYLYEYDEKFTFQKRHVLDSGYTLMGIQTAAFADGHWWFGCYGTPQVLLKADDSFQLVGKWEFDASLGITGIPVGSFLVARGKCEKGSGCTGRVLGAVADDQNGLRLTEEEK